MTDIFVSYSRKDRDTVEKLVEALKSRGWSVWWDTRIRPGEYFDDVIEQALTDARCVVVVWSKNAVASKWVRAEASEAANLGVLVPAVIDDAKIPLRFKQIQEANLSDWKFTPDHPGLLSLLDSIAEKFIDAEDARNSEAISPTREIEEGPRTPPEQHHDQDTAASSSSSPVDEDAAPVDLASADRGKPPLSAEAQRSHAYPVRRQPPEDVATAERARSPLGLKRKLLAAVLIFFGIAAVVGAVYVISTRKFANSGNGGRSEVAQQNGALNQNVNRSYLSPATPTPAMSPAVSTVESRKIEGLLRGKWQSQNVTSDTCECENSGCLDIQFNKPIPDFCIQSNQIYVSAWFGLDAPNKKAYLFFSKPGNDMGAAASQMPWNKFDRKKPLATIDLSDLETQRVLYITWHGFTEIGDAGGRWRQLGSGFQGTYTRRRGR